MTCPILSVRFFCTDVGNEPVRDFLKDQTIEDRHMVLLHAFVKKSQQTPKTELDTAFARLKKLKGKKA